MAEDPYILAEGQDYIAEKDPEREHGIIVKEAKPVKLYLPGEFLELGRELCLPNENFYQVPDYDLCAVMGKDQVCEEQAGKARVVWCTTHASDGVVYASLVGPTGPWTLVASHSDDRHCHDLEFNVLGVDAKHWFYVESTSSLTGVTLQGSGIFCSGIVLVVTTSASFAFFTVTKPILKQINMSADDFAGDERYPQGKETSNEATYTPSLTKYVDTPGVGEEQKVDLVLTPVDENRMTSGIKSMTLSP